MCGIAGLLSSRPLPEASQILSAMLQSILHRGPDESGELLDGSVAMGMRRLSIIDLADGSQPIFDESGRFGIVFNGEIYNYRELRKELQSRGHHLKTCSDTETIVHLYEEQQECCLEHLRGMFAFAVWDRQQGELFLARDRMGIKPLYYTWVAGELIFASEIKAILQHPAVVREVDEMAMSQYLSLKYVPAPRTLFKGIFALPPGYWMKADVHGRWTIERYWDLRFVKTAPAVDEREYTDRLLTMLRESVGLHLRSDVPFGAFLSGGLDSSTIVALMAEQLTEPVKTFSVGFDGSGLQDELPYAQQVAQKFGCEHHTLKISANDFLNLADQVLFHLDQPLADQATIATWMVSRLARQHVKMVLTGEGGDELFAGYARYSGERYRKYLEWLPPSLGNLIRSGVERLPGLRRAKIAISALTLDDEASRFSNWFPMFKDGMKEHLFRKEFLGLRQGVADLYRQHLEQCDAKTPLDRMLYVDCKLWLADYLLLRGDKLTMANSLEARVPLLDHHVVEFAASLPESMKLRGRQRKYLLRQVARRLLPGDVIDRKKQGFPIPIESWLRREAAPMLHDLLNEGSVQRRGYFQWNLIDKLIQEHTSGFADHSTELWGLISLEMWFQRFIDSPVHSSDALARPSASSGVNRPSDLVIGDHH